MKRKISVIIPVYNKASLTCQCLDALINEDHSDFAVELIVVNDASSDSTVKLLSSHGDRVIVIHNEQNCGFAQSCNTGAGVAGGEYLIFLNNDIIPSDGWLEALVRYADKNPRAAVVGSKLLYPDGTIQHAGVVICQERYPIHVYSGFPADHPAVNKSRRFAIVTAACALFRPKPFHAANGFDTKYQNGMEDVDLCLRLCQLGHEIHYCAESVLTHLESVTRDVVHEERENNKIFFRRWWSELQPDDFRYYLEDGLVKVGYRQPYYPLPVSISPLLATVDEEGRRRETDELLNRRAAQVFSLLKDNVRLSVCLQEAISGLDRDKQRNGDTSKGEKGELLPEPRVLCRGEVRWPKRERRGKIVSIIMPVKNGEDKLQRLMPVLQQQETHVGIELIGVDSGSKDETVEVLKKAGATVIAIDPQSYNHGLTRNLGAEYARGEVFIFLNQRALPANDQWLKNLLAPLENIGDVAGVCSRTVPYEDADILTKRDVERDEDSSTKRQIREIRERNKYDAMSHDSLRLFINFHTISAAIRSKIFKMIPFREVIIGEDIQWAKEVLEAGYKIQHEPSSIVFHSHNYSIVEMFQRHFDDGIANRKIVGRKFKNEDVFPAIISLVKDDWEYLRGMCKMDQKERDRWMIESVMRRIAQTVGEWIGVNTEYIPQEVIPLLSLTERIKLDNKTEERRRPSGEK